MIKRRSYLRLYRYGGLVSGLFALHQLGCLPNNAFSQVTADNLVFTSAVFIQSVTAVIFNTIFSLFGTV